MALLFMEGFDAYASNTELTAKWQHGDFDGGEFIQLYPNLGRRGTTCAGPTIPQAGPLDAYATIVPSEVGAGIIIGYAGRNQGFDYNSNYLEISVWQNSNDFFSYGKRITISVYIESDTSVITYMDGTVFGDYFYQSSTVPSGVLNFNEWHYVESKILISDSIPANSCVVKIDGIEVFNLPEGTDTTILASPTHGFSKIQLSGLLYDDIYVCDTSGTENNDFLGDCRVDVIRPASDGTYHEGTPTTGTSHYSLVNQVQYNPAVGIVLDTTGYKESYTMTQLLPSGIVSNNVHGIELATVGYNLDGSGTKRMGKLAVQGVTELELNDSNDGILTSPSFNFQITATDADAAQWTVSSVNNAQFGIVLKP